MLTRKTDSASLFAKWHPHFTPEWLSHLIARNLPSDFVGAIVDPACGAGNLLVAAAMRTRASARSGQVEFIGIDTSNKAIKACERALSALLPDNMVNVCQADFLTRKSARPSLKRVAVVMNPPFSGYGEITKSRREKLGHLLSLEGRFNLAHAFVQRALTLYKPDMLVALLPSNWAHANKSPFRRLLGRYEGTWKWRDIGSGVFEGVETHVGILLWRSVPGINSIATNARGGERKLILPGVEIRQGVATGRDALFAELGGKSMPFGRRVLAVRGRDIERATGTLLWLPPQVPNSKHAKLFAAHVSKWIVNELRLRSCVADRGKYVFQYHESVPKWFQGWPKLLIPEISTENIRVEFDISGRKLPLHSVFAIRVPNARIGGEIRRFLKAQEQQRYFLRTGPRLAGGAVRLEANVLRKILLRWATNSKIRARP